MKVIFSHGLPFSLAHGGMQTLIVSLMRELADLGVEVEPERWWDPNQTCDIMHFIQRPHPGIARLAKQRGRKLVMTENYDVVASESRFQLLLRSCATGAAKTLVPSFGNKISFYSELDAMVYVVRHELDVVRRIYRLPSKKGFIVPHGLDPNAIKALSEPQPECDYLASVGTICSRKNSVLLAICARKAKIPIVFVGKPLSEADSYFQQFLDLVDDKYVKFIGYVSEEKKHETLRGARGFVLLSIGESGCIAVYEAAAAGLPLLLSDLPWATNGYPVSDRLHFVPIRSVSGIVKRLKSFYGTAHRERTMTFPVGTWADVAKAYLSIYEGL